MAIGEPLSPTSLRLETAPPLTYRQIILVVSDLQNRYTELWLACRLRSNDLARHKASPNPRLNKESGLKFRTGINPLTEKPEHPDKTVIELLIPEDAFLHPVLLLGAKESLNHLWQIQLQAIRNSTVVIPKVFFE